MAESRPACRSPWRACTALLAAKRLRVIPPVILLPNMSQVLARKPFQARIEWASHGGHRAGVERDASRWRRVRANCMDSHKAKCRRVLGRAGAAWNCLEQLGEEVAHVERRLPVIRWWRPIEV